MLAQNYSYNRGLKTESNPPEKNHTHYNYMQFSLF